MTGIGRWESFTIDRGAGRGLLYGNLTVAVGLLAFPMYWMFASGFQEESAIIFGFIAAWGEYVFALTILDSASEWTYAVGVASLKGEYQVHWNEIMSASFVSTLPVLLLFLFMQRYLLAGLTAGGVKG